MWNFAMQMQREPNSSNRSVSRVQFAPLRMTALAWNLPKLFRRVVENEASDSISIRVFRSGGTALEVELEKPRFASVRSDGGNLWAVSEVLPEVIRWTTPGRHGRTGTWNLRESR